MNIQYTYKINILTSRNEPSLMNTKTILFTFLMAALIISFSGVPSIAADVTLEYEPIVIIPIGEFEENIPKYILPDPPEYILPGPTGYIPGL